MSKYNKPYHNYNNYSANNAAVKTEEPVIENEEMEAVTEEVTEEIIEAEVSAEELIDEPIVATEEPEIVEPTPITGVVTGCGELRVRVAPNTNADILCKIEKDSEVQIIESESTEEFYKVITEAGAEGYCMKKFITIK